MKPLCNLITEGSFIGKFKNKTEEDYKCFIGRIYGFYTVEKYFGKEGRHHLFLCRDIFGFPLIAKRSYFVKSQGFGKFLHGESSKLRTILLGAYTDMLRRCYDCRAPNYHKYGAKGITVCESWLGENGRESFFIWAVKTGWKKGLCIDRIDSDLGYIPENCRFLSKKESARPRKGVLLSEEKASYIRETFKLSNLSRVHYCKQKAKEFGTKYETIRSILEFKTWN